MPRVCRSFAGLSFLAVAALARPAAAYHEAHMTADDVRITVDDTAVARVDHAITYRVLGGTLKAFDLNGLEPGASPDSEASVTTEGGAASDALVERRGDRGLHVTILAPKGLARGTYVVHVRYQVDLVQSHALAMDGALWRLTWTAPVAAEGYDGARVTFDLPAAQTEPRVVTSDGAPAEGARMATLRRAAERDELEIARPHVARGEAATWTIRVDPKAFPEVRDPALRPPPPAPPPPPDRWRATLVIAGLAALAIAFGALVHRKSRVVADACAARGVSPRPLAARVPGWARASLAGIAFAAGVACEALGEPTVGAAAIAIAMALAAHLAPTGAAKMRGPGRWLALAPNDAFAAVRTGGALDFGSRAGKLTAFAAALAVAALAFALRRVDVEWSYLVALDALALVPIFLTGTAAQLPPDLARAPIPALRALHRVLKKDRALRVAPWARVPVGADRADELRLLVLPRAAMPGLGGIEIGVAWRRTWNGHAPSTEVLVRFHDATAAAARMTALAPFARAVPGRKPDERVVRLTPALPARRATVALVDRLVRELVDRRVAVPAAKATWRGTERRILPNKRVAQPVAA